MTGIETYDDLLAVMKRLTERKIGFILAYCQFSDEYCLNMRPIAHTKAVKSFPFLAAKKKPEHGFSLYFRLSGMPDKKQEIVNAPDPSVKGPATKPRRRRTTKTNP